MQVTTNGKAKQPTKKALQQRIADLEARCLEHLRQFEAAVTRVNELEQIAAEDEDRMLKDDNRIVELEEQLQETMERLKAAEAAALGKPQSATPPPGGFCEQSLMPPAPGVMRVWLMLHDNGYQVKLVHMGTDGWGWEFIKQCDGTRYHLFEGTRGPVSCDCPGATRHGPECANGKGCKHVRMLRAVRNLVYPGLVTVRRRDPENLPYHHEVEARSE